MLLNGKSSSILAGIFRCIQLTIPYPYLKQIGSLSRIDLLILLYMKASAAHCIGNMAKNAAFHFHNKERRHIAFRLYLYAESDVKI